MILRCTLAIVFLWAGAAGVPAYAQATGDQPLQYVGDSDTVTVSFVNAEIDGVVKMVSALTGKNFVIDPRVKGTITIVSAEPVRRDQVYELFLSALRLQGFTAIDDRGIVRVIPEADAKLHPSPTGSAGDRSGASGDQIQTLVFTLRHESAAQLVPILRPLISPNNAITAYPGSNTLVITDYANNMQRLARIIASVDQPTSVEPIVIPLQYASAVDVAATVNQLFQEPGQAGGSIEPVQRFMVVADLRSNSLLVRVGNPVSLARLRKMVAMLDSATSAGGNIHVVYLKNAEAVKLAETLRAIFQGNVAAPVAVSPLVPGPLANAAQGPATAPEPAAPTSPGIIQADAATNSIIITAPDAIYNNIRAALDKLDVRRAQVYVEALIVELTADKAAEFGVQWQNLSGLGENDTAVFGGTNFGGAGQNIIGISQNPASAGPGLNIGLVNGQVTIPGIGQILNIGVLARALETRANANILSTPMLLTLDNEAAEIIIGQNVPFITGQFALSGSAVTPTPFQTIERHDVGLTLRIKPQISEGGTVRLEIYQEVSSINDKTNPAGVITNKRAVSSMVLVDDGQIVVIGGLIQDAVTDGVDQVPVLGRIPVLGGLFRQKSRTHNKTNLMIFLRPTVVRDRERADVYTSARYHYILGEQARARPEHSRVLPDMDVPTMPPLDPPVAAPALPGRD